MSTSAPSYRANIPDVVRFWLLLFLDVPAAFCSIFFRYHLLEDRVHLLV